MLIHAKLVRTAEFLTRRWYESYRHNIQLRRLNEQVARHEPKHSPEVAPVIFFNASTRIWGLSLNAAFSLLASWGLRLSGVPIQYYMCRSGMEQCVLGTTRTRLHARPPCSLCTRLSHQMYPRHLTHSLEPSQAQDIKVADIEHALTLEELKRVVVEGLPIGELCFPSLRWVLRKHNIPDTVDTRALFRKYLRASIHIANTFERLIHETNPRAVVVFNGVTFPEAVVRQVAIKHKIDVITHEVGIQPFSAFFTHGEATTYPIQIDEDWTLSPQEERTLDEYLASRFEGEFTMAGVRFWPQMQDIDNFLGEKTHRFRQIIAVFSNVIFDTSQVHANVVFSDMFAWLNSVVSFARKHPETLFVFRAHPDELRIGKESLETVEMVLRECGALEMDNIVFIPPQKFVSSYELIRISKIVMVYNSSIGLEATILGRIVLCGGKSRFTAHSTVYFPQTPNEYFEMAERFLDEDAPIAPAEFVHRARRFTFYQNFHTSLDFSAFLRAHDKFPGYVFMKNFDPLQLHTDRCEEIRILRDGIFEGTPMVYKNAHFQKLA